MMAFQSSETPEYLKDSGRLITQFLAHDLGQTNVLVRIDQYELITSYNWTKPDNHPAMQVPGIQPPSLNDSARTARDDQPAILVPGRDTSNN